MIITEKTRFSVPVIEIFWNANIIKLHVYLSPKIVIENFFKEKIKASDKFALWIGEGLKITKYLFIFSLLNKM